MKLQKCEMCDKTVLRLSEHHMIPWYLSHDDSESNIMRLCASCHRKADARFNNLILYGKMNVADETQKRTRARYSKKYMKNKQLHIATLSKHTYYQDLMWYNTKTGVIGIRQYWFYTPYKHISRRITNSIINHRKRAKAAAVKGQTTLDGRF